VVHVNENIAAIFTTARLVSWDQSELHFALK